MLLPCAGCGFATLGAAGAAAGGSGGGSGTPAVLSGFAVESTSVSPALVSFVLEDAQAETTEVAFYYTVELPGEDPVTRLMGALDVGSNPIDLATSPEGVPYAFEWDFPMEPDLPGSDDFLDGVQVFALVPGVLDDPVPGVNSVVVGLGNEAPIVVDIEVPATEAEGVVGIPITVSDSSADTVDLRIEFDLTGDDPDAGFQLCTPQFAIVAPPFAVTDLATTPAGVQTIFAWNTDRDLEQSESGVRLRVTAVDPLVESTPRLSDEFNVDNNASSIAVIDGGALLADPDRRRGLPIPLRLLDPESDPLRVVVQWREVGGSAFPALPATRAAVEALLDDPAAAEAAGVARAFSRRAAGRVGAVDAASAVLPELAQRFPWVLAEDTDGRELRIDRPRAETTALVAGWPGTALNNPVDCLIEGDGASALVLDAEGAGGWRLRRIDLESGQAELLGVGTGLPGALAFEAQRESVLLGVGAASDWRLLRVTLANGAVDTLYTRQDPLPAGELVALVARSNGTAIAALGDSLIEIDFRPGLDPVAFVLLSGLSQVWGIAADPTAPERLLVAQFDIDPGSGSPDGQLAWFDLRRRCLEPIPVQIAVNGAPSGASLRRPRALALAPTGTRAIVWAESSGEPGVRRLYDVGLGAAGGSLAVSLGEAGGTLRGIDCGPDGFCLAAWTSAGELLAVCGAQQRIPISGTAPERSALLFEQTAGISPGAAWSIVTGAPATLPSSPGGRQSVFIWDSSQLGRDGLVQFRATPYDFESGLAGESTVSKAVRAGLDVDGVLLDGFDAATTRQAVAADSGDVDADGDLDLVAGFALGDLPIDLFLQTSPQVFASAGDAPFEPDVGLLSLADLELGDVDGDGDLDLAISDLTLEAFGILRHSDTELSFLAAEVDRLGGPEETPSPRQIDLADLDLDGDLDLLGSHANGTAVYLQDGAGLFTLAQSLDGGTGRPLAVSLGRDGLQGVIAGNVGTGALLHFPAETGVPALPFVDVPESLGSAVGFDVDELLGADLDRDGGLDLVLSGGSQLGVLGQGQDGSFGGPPQLLALPAVPGGFAPGELSSADADGDGDIDLFSAAVGVRSSALHFGRDAALPAGTPLAVGPAGSLIASQPGSSASLARDFDADGSLDLVHGAGGALELFSGAGPARFDAAGAISYGSLTAGTTPRFALAPDVDGDADLDLLLTNPTGPPLLLLQSTPTAFVQSVLPQTTPPLASLALAAGDLDGDGRIDVVSAADARLRIHFQDPAGQFPASAAVVLENAGLFDFADDLSGRGLELGDADGDGDLDIAFAAADNTAIGYLLNEDGVFDTSAAELFGDDDLFDSPRQVRLLDATGDGIVDLIGADLVTDELVIFPGGPGGIGAAAPIRLAAAQPYLVEACDLDGDGRVDLITNGASAGEVQVLYGFGGGAFAGALELDLPGAGSGQFVRAIQAADLDADGDLDLAVKIDARVAVLRQAAPRVFGGLPGAPLGEVGSQTSFSEALLARDLDGDGELDLIAGDSGNLRLVVHYAGH